MAQEFTKNELQEFDEFVMFLITPWRDFILDALDLQRPRLLQRYGEAYVSAYKKDWCRVNFIISHKSYLVSMPQNGNQPPVT